MRILYVTQGFPYPLTSGYLRQYHFIRELAARHTIRLLSLTGHDFVPEHASAMAPFVEDVRTFRTSDRSRSLRRKATGRLRAWLDPEHGDAAAHGLRRAVQESLRDSRYDAMIASGRRTFPAVSISTVPVVADLCDATSMRLRGQLQHARAARRLLLGLEYAHVRDIEGRLVRRAAHLLFASARDRDALGRRVDRQRASVVANGVDLEYWQRREPRLGGSDIVFTGAMNYPPNEDAALFLAEAILPRVLQVIPEARLWIVGRDPRPGLVAAGKRPGVTVTGTVSDVRPYLERAAVFAAPLRFGAGIQNKILEAMAMEVPVVTSLLAAAGLRTEEGHEPPLLAASDEEALAAAIVARLEAARRDSSPAHIARAFVAKHYAWKTVGEKLEAILSRVTDVANRGSSR